MALVRPAGPDGRSELAAVHVSSLRHVPHDVLGQLLAEAVGTDVAAGEVVHREGDRVPHLDLVVSGLVRVFVTAPDGRTMTVRYVRRGGLLGAVSLFPSRFELPATIQAVTDARLLRLPPDLVRHAAETDLRVARALIDELSERVLAFIGEISSGAFATVRQRVARHLLDLASERRSGHVLRAAISQRELAEAVGSVREVVVRALRDLREDHVLDTGRHGMDVLDPERLAAEAFPAQGDGPDGGWNPGS